MCTYLAYPSSLIAFRLRPVGGLAGRFQWASYEGLLLFGPQLQPPQHKAPASIFGGGGGVV